MGRQHLLLFETHQLSSQLWNWPLFHTLPAMTVLRFGPVVLLQPTSAQLSTLYHLDGWCSFCIRLFIFAIKVSAAGDAVFHFCCVWMHKEWVCSHALLLVTYRCVLTIKRVYCSVKRCNVRVDNSFRWLVVCIGFQHFFKNEIVQLAHLEWFAFLNGRNLQGHSCWCY